MMPVDQATPLSPIIRSLFAGATPRRAVSKCSTVSYRSASSKRSAAHTSQTTDAKAKIKCYVALDFLCVSIILTSAAKSD